LRFSALYCTLWANFAAAPRLSGNRRGGRKTQGAADRARMARSISLYVIICADFLESATNTAKKSAITQSIRLRFQEIRICAISLLIMNTVKKRAQIVIINLGERYRATAHPSPVPVKMPPKPSAVVGGCTGDEPPKFPDPGRAKLPLSRSPRHNLTPPSPGPLSRDGRVTLDFADWLLSTSHHRPGLSRFDLVSTLDEQTHRRHAGCLTEARRFRDAFTTAVFATPKFRA
jgi:hypothetical protein